MAVTLSSFLTSFPEFSSTDASRIIEHISQVEIEACYDTFDLCVSELAIKLHTAHLLSQFNATTSEYNLGGQKVSKVKTKHDEITMHPTQGDPFDLSSTQYGNRLQQLIDRHSVGFTMTFC